MPRLNDVDLCGPVIKTDIQVREDGRQEVVMVMAVIRGYRNVGDGRKNIKIDRPIIMSRNKEMIYKIASWKKNDIVRITGAVTSRTRNKRHICAFCKQENHNEGLSVYIEPKSAEKLFTFRDDSESLSYLNTIRETSNRVKLFGNLCRDPKKVAVKNGPVVTQYPLAVGRVFTVHEDPPNIDTDYPWVKSYGPNAISDRRRLKLGSTIFLDGIIQTRSINRKTVCEHCGKLYEWKERTLELVPYQNEYIANFYTEEEAIENEKKRNAQRLKDLGYDKYLFNDDQLLKDYDNDEITEEDIAAGIDTELDS